MADLINFVSKREIDAKKEHKRKAREEILKKAKEDYEREQRKKERRKESGESTWMLPALSQRLTEEAESHKKDTFKRKKHKKEKKQKKGKKEKKHKKKAKDIPEGSASSSQSEDDEWIEKGADTTITDAGILPNLKQVQRDSWMLCPPITSSNESQQTMEVDEEEGTDISEEDDRFKALSCIDRPGQHPKELNPYWKDGGTGLPSQPEVAQDTTVREGSLKSSFSSAWLKKAYQRAKEQATEERRSLEEIVAQRFGSVEDLESMIKEAEQRESKYTAKPRIDARHQSDYGKRGKDDARNRSRSTDRLARHRREGHDHDEGERKSSRDTKESWRRRPERENETRERARNDTPRFLRPDENNGSSFAGKFKRPATSAQTSTSSTWDFDSKQEPHSKESLSSDRTMPRPSGRWKKKLETGSVKSSSSGEVDRRKEENVQDRNEVSGSESSSSSEAEEEEEKERIILPAKQITETDLNEIGAKIVKAEIMGNEDLAAKLKSQLDEMRKTKDLRESQTKEGGATAKRTEETVVLTRTDAAGNVRPLEITKEREYAKGKKKRRKVDTHSKEGKRERYFADDDRYDLKEMVRREKMQTAEDHNAMLARLSSKAASMANSDDFSLDDHFVSSAANKISAAQLEERERQKAIKEHRLLAAQLSKCHFCFENPDIAKHLIIAIGFKVYLAVPLHQSLTEGHCLIVPMQHCSASTLLDEDVWSEIKIYKKELTKMFEEMEQDVVFLETCKQLKKQRHMIIECIPLAKEIGDMSPIYFKKAILESDTEWAQNKKLIDTSKKGLRAAVPKGLPYFSVEFGLDGGFAHVIEEEDLFPHYFGKEIVGGMLDLEPHRWRKPRKENFEEHKKKVLQFGEWWEPFDWTKKIERTKC
ncbi:CWF19-like protein 2 [Montipora capricornis]|uniref:CWF19-like protein 2 n=1 Tax=Montipora capricornis TaxID=246305 RepID=UPI0035F1F136